MKKIVSVDTFNDFHFFLLLIPMKNLVACTNTFKHHSSITCCCMLALTPLVLLDLIQCQSLLGIGDENLSDKAER